MRDALGRTIDYLRLSVTDACNLRCGYCVSRGEGPACPGGSPLDDGEVLALVRAFARLGVSRVRVTGGEPLLRPGLEGLVGGIAGVAGVRSVSLSTNGVLLAEAAPRLAAAGLSRVNISLDTLRPERMRRLAGADRLAEVLAGVDAALAAGLRPVKVNVVVARGCNEDEVPDFVRLASERDVHVRFIELMPIGNTGFFTPERRVGVAELLERAGPLEPLPEGERPCGAGPASYFRPRGARGTVGFIGALSRCFCSACNRVRLTSRGRILLCIGREGPELDLAALLRAGASEPELDAALGAFIRLKPARHRMSAEAGPARNSMCSVGG
ncbi:MAG: cyclic pyranopterin phosphate synthase MoaA [Elusimicrobia bacterium GWA2_69_24]|nr:MAG: cyclic pyranopterin phosphate synthase MoaA [Elusimicrobia bacterium GWA2_69_24]